MGLPVWCACLAWVALRNPRALSLREATQPVGEGVPEEAQLGGPETRGGCFWFQFSAGGKAGMCEKEC